MAQILIKEMICRDKTDKGALDKIILIGSLLGKNLCNKVRLKDRYFKGSKHRFMVSITMICLPFVMIDW